ncbi:MAG: TadE family protein [Chloroflexota bacterium]
MPRNSARRSRFQRGQALTEFALVSIVLALFLAGSIEFGLLYSHKVELANAARAGARWAAAHPTSWTAVASPASNTVEGQVLGAGGTAQVANDDSHLTIEYLDSSPATPVLCGRYSVAGAGFAAQPGYTQATCVVPGSLARVTVTQSYPLLTAILGGLFGAAVTVKGTATMPVMA